MMKDFVQLQPLTWQKLYNQYLILKKQSKNQDEILNDLSSTLSQIFHSDVALNIAQKVLNSFESSSLPLKFYNAVSSLEDSQDLVTKNIDYVLPEAQLTLYDINILKEKMKNETDPAIARLLVAFLIYARANPHHTNWIKYDRKVIMFLSSLSKKKVSEQTLLTNKLHNLYNVNMRVVGSTQPIPCFNISWHDDQPLVNSPENPLIDIGPVEPDTISKFVTKNLIFKKEDKK